MALYVLFRNSDLAILKVKEDTQGFCPRTVLGDGITQIAIANKTMEDYRQYERDSEVALVDYVIDESGVSVHKTKWYDKATDKWYEVKNADSKKYPLKFSVPQQSLISRMGDFAENKETEV